MNLTANVVASTKTSPVNSASSGAGNFKDALQSANHLPAPASSSPAREKADVQSKQKKKDESTKSDSAAQGQVPVQQVSPVQSKPVLAVSSQQALDGTSEVSADDTSVTSVQVASAISAEVSAAPSSGWPSLPGDPTNQDQQAVSHAATLAKDADAESDETSSQVVASKNENQDQITLPGGNQPSASSVQGMTLPKDLLQGASNKDLQAMVDGVAASGTNGKSEKSDKPQSIGAKVPLNTTPDTQLAALPGTAVQTAVPTAVPMSVADVSSAVSNKPLEQIEGAALSGRKGPAGVDSKSRRKSDEDSTQTTPVARTSAPAIDAPRSVIDPTARLDQSNDQIQAGQAAMSAAPQDHAKVESFAAESGPSIASASPSASDVHLPETASMQALSGAHLVQSIHQSEMKLGLNSTEFGSISINTSVTHQVLSAQISLDHPELSRILAAHMPAVEEKLGQAYGLQTRVEVRDGASAQSGARQQGGGSESARAQQATQFGRGSVTRAISAVAGGSVTSDVARLDVRV